MNTKEILEELYSLRRFGMKPGLDNIKSILKEFDNPHNNCGKIIHIAGTNGKGSTATFLEKALIEAGYRVGKYTSPHIVEFNERIVRNEVRISDEELIEYYLQIKKVIEKKKLLGTFFEITTVIMFLYFRDKNIDYLILEVGLGGTYDATNVVDPIYSVVTNVSLDHINILGDSLEEIASEKVGIIKKSPAIIGSDIDELVEEVKKKTSDYVVVEKKYRDAKISLRKEDYSTLVEVEDEEYELSLFGKFQGLNFLTAYEVLRRLGIEKEIIKKAVKKVFWQGRFEIFSKKPLIILDGAHNEDSALKLKENLNEFYKKEDVVMICSFLEDKEIDKISSSFSEIAESAIFTSLEDFHRGISGKKILERVDSFKYSYCEEEIEDAYEKALSLNKKVIVVCGSFYLVSKFKESFYGKKVKEKWDNLL